jgi:hypothetical protein
MMVMDCLLLPAVYRRTLLSLTYLIFYMPPSNAEVEERIEQYLYAQFGSSWPVLG